MTEAEAIKSIRQAAKRRERTLRARLDATNDLRRSCEAAQAAGVPISRIAQEAGLSRQGVYDLLGQRPS